MYLTNSDITFGENLETVIKLCEPVTNIPAIKIELEDPGTWPKLNLKLVQLIVEKGPVQVVNYNFPANRQRRKFIVNSYKRTIENGQSVDRTWLVYSVSLDVIFCFC